MRRWTPTRRAVGVRDPPPAADRNHIRIFIQGLSRRFNPARYNLTVTINKLDIRHIRVRFPQSLKACLTGTRRRKGKRHIQLDDLHTERSCHLHAAVC
jgi:hypothetical protein